MTTIDVTRENFEKLVLENGIVILDFWASWCGPCRVFAPIFEQAAVRHGDVVFGKVNTEQQQELAGAFGVRSIPTLMVFRDRVLLFQQAGALPESVFEELISKVKALDMDQVRADIARQEAESAQPAQPKTGS